MSPSFVNEEYINLDKCVSWYGEKFLASDEFDAFLDGPVKSRLDDNEGTYDFQSCLRGLDLTGMGRTCLEEILSSNIPESRNWAVGEALAEAWLIEAYEVIFPWNMVRDKRNPFASLPGADLVGFIKDKNGFRLAMGEVKTSTEKESPPQVMLGRSGMENQLDNLINNKTIISQLLLWLFHRTRNETSMQVYESFFTNYFNSQCKDIVLFGVLIRDTAPNELDLSGRGKKLRAKLNTPTQCHLIALYLPWGIEELGVHLRKGGSK
jgi:hypothetical protein